MGIEVIIKDEKGLVTATLSKTMNTLQEPMVGEAMRALLAVEFNSDIRLFDIILEGDSKQVVDAITGTGSP